MGVAAVRPVVEHGLVLAAAVVPERHRVLLPLEAAVKLRRLDMAEQHLEQRVAFVALELSDLRREAAVDEQQLALGHRMGADHRVLGLRELLVGRAIAAAVRMRLGAVVDRGEPFEITLHRIRQRLIGAYMLANMVSPPPLAAGSCM